MLSVQVKEDESASHSPAAKISSKIKSKIQATGVGAGKVTVKSVSWGWFRAPQ